MTAVISQISRETLTLILRTVLHDLLWDPPFVCRSPDVSYLGVLETLQLVSRTWNEVVLKDQLIWSRVVIHNDISYLYLQKCLRRAGTRLLTLLFFLRHPLSKKERQKFTHLPVHTPLIISFFLERAFTILRPFFPRCSSVMVHTVEPLSTRLVLASLARITAPNVRVVEFILRPSSAEMQHFVVDAEGPSSYPAPFSNKAPILQHLIMSSIILTWVSSPVFSNLTTLYLGSHGFSHSVVGYSEASVNGLCTLFCTANHLTRLHLIRVIYSADPVVAVSFAALFYLTHLELEIYNKSLREIVAALVLPALRTLSLIGPHYGALSQFHLECCHLYNGLTPSFSNFPLATKATCLLLYHFYSWYTFFAVLISASSVARPDLLWFFRHYFSISVCLSITPATLYSR